jgi:hypothetical protein
MGEAMMNRLICALGVSALLAGCSKPAPPAPRNQAPATINQWVPSPAPLPPTPRPTIDPKSSAAAEELVRGFVALINSGKLDDAYMLLGPNAPSRSEFDKQFNGYSHLHASQGTAGDQEGAAGSIYVSVPLTISGDQDGKHIDRSADAVLRRVNDVPGSTEAQRHWHIERIDWK